MGHAVMLHCLVMIDNPSHFLITPISSGPIIKLSCFFDLIPIWLPFPHGLLHSDQSQGLHWQTLTPAGHKPTVTSAIQVNN